MRPGEGFLQLLELVRCEGRTVPTLLSSRTVLIHVRLLVMVIAAVVTYGSLASAVVVASIRGRFVLQILNVDLFFIFAVLRGGTSLRLNGRLLRMLRQEVGGDKVVD